MGVLSNGGVSKALSDEGRAMICSLRKGVNRLWGVCGKSISDIGNGTCKALRCEWAGKRRNSPKASRTRVQKWEVGFEGCQVRRTVWR